MSNLIASIPGHPSTAKTRFVLISDTHNASPPSAFQLPPGDVLIHAGDLTKNGTIAELRAALSWIEKADYQIKVVIAGNHDSGLDSLVPSIDAEGNNDEGAEGDDATIRTSDETASKTDRTSLMQEFPSITYLQHESETIRLPRHPWTQFKIFGSPLSPEPENLEQDTLREDRPRRPFSAFQYPSSDTAPNPWDSIPSPIDLIVTHTPPRSHCDDDGHGCPLLQRAITRLKPRLAVCGHVHAGRGAELVLFPRSENAAQGGGLDSPVHFKQTRVMRWKDPSSGTKRQAKIDLTLSREQLRTEDWEVLEDRVVGPRSLSVGEIDVGDDTGAGEASTAPTVVGEAFQTCIANAAIMSTSWPYKSGQKRFNKAIVVVMDLPTWRS